MNISQLEGISLFEGLDEAVMESIAASMQEITVPVGTVVTSEDDLASRVFAIADGVAVVGDAHDVVATLRRGDVFGEIGALGAGRRTANVVAVTPMTLLSWFSWDFRSLVETNPELEERVERLIAERIAEWERLEQQET